MDKCSEAQKLIPLFLDDDLDNLGLSEFLSHVDNCPDCREELMIQLLVKVGMERLEDGNTFNLNKEYDNLISESRKKLSMRMSLVFLSFVLKIAVTALLAVCITLLIVL